MKTIKLTIICTLIVGLFMPSIVAAAPSGVTLSPISFNGNYRPGESATTEFTLTNNASETMTFSLQKAELTEHDIVTNADSAAGWLTLSADEITLSAQESAKVLVTLVVSDKAEVKAYYPAILIKLANTPSSPGAGTAIDPNLAFKIGINVTTVLPKNSIEIRKLNISNPTVLGQATVSYQIVNPLTLFIKPIAYLQVLNAADEQVFSTVINENMASLPPGGELSGTLNVSLPFDVRSVGQYRAELLVIDKQFGNTEILKANFWVVPIWIILGVTIAIVFAILILHRKRR